MIDTDKYEGHTPGPWEWSKLRDAGSMRLGTAGVDKRRKEFKESIVMGEYPPHPAARAPERRLWGSLSDANKLLITDAPLLLEEVKRLRMYEVAWKMLYDNAIEEERETRTRTWKEIMELVRSDVKEMVDTEDAVFGEWAKRTIGGFE